MKKQVLIGSVLLAAISAYSQTSHKLKPTGLINTKMLAEMKFGVESAPSANVSSAKPLAIPSRNNSNAKAATTTINWQIISSSMNIYGMIIPYTKPLQWNDELNAVSFVHRKSPTYQFTTPPSPNAESGAIIALISTDCGTSWDSTAMFSNNTFWGRYPGGAIYNPQGNTSMSNAYIVGAGPTTGNGSSTSWIGNWYASKQLGTYNATPGTGNSQQVIATSGPFPAGVPSRHDFAAYGFTATDDGKMRVLAGITNDVTQSDTAVMMMTGTFNGTTNTFDWTGTVFDPPTTVAPSDNSDNWVSRPMQAWNESGSTGYVVIMGQRLGATGSNAGNQPIVYKSTDFGATWTLENGIDFTTTDYNDVKFGLWPTSGGGDTVPNFWWAEGMDCAVDMNGKLHIFATLLGHATADADSLNFINQWTSEDYLWPHVPGTRPFLWDFTYDGTASTPSWSHMLIDSMSSESPSGVSTGAGYQDNPWDMDPSTNNQKVRIDARLQMSRTPDGRYLMYTWAESDTSVTVAQKKWNSLPNIKARLYDVANNDLSPTEMDMTAGAAQQDVAFRAMYHTISPKFKMVNEGSLNVTVDLPTTVSNSNPYSQLTKNYHWYSCAEMDFDRSAPVVITGVGQNSSISANNSSIYPNPAKNSVVVGLNLAASSKVQIQVMNTMGQVVRTVSAQGQTGANAVNVDLSGLATGMYMVNIKVDNASSTKKLIIE